MDDDNDDDEYGTVTLRERFEALRSKPPGRPPPTAPAAGGAEQKPDGRAFQEFKQTRAKSNFGPMPTMDQLGMAVRAPVLPARPRGR